MAVMRHLAAKHWESLKILISKIPVTYLPNLKVGILFGSSQTGKFLKVRSTVFGLQYFQLKLEPCPTLATRCHDSDASHIVSFSPMLLTSRIPILALTVISAQ